MMGVSLARNEPGRQRCGTRTQTDPTVGCGHGHEARGQERAQQQYGNRQQPEAQPTAPQAGQ